MARPADARVPNLALIQLREDAGLSQEDLANELNDLAARKHGKHPMITKKTVGRRERGEVDWPQPLYRRLLAEYFGVAVDELGFRRPRRHNPAATSSSTDELLTLVATPGSVDPRVEADQRRWQAVRTGLDRNRGALAVLAEQLYSDHHIAGLEGTGVITHSTWLPAQPLPLDQIHVELDTAAADPVITGQEKETAATRPLASTEQRYRRYHHAVRDIALPRLFENHLCFRLLAVDWSPTAPRLRFGQMCFFDSIDINEVLAHETALHHLIDDANGRLATTKPSWRRLAFRKLIGDPFDLTRRPLMGAVGTLTIRAGASPSMVLHHRDAGRVAGGGGMAHLLPAGIFQPSSVLPDAINQDFSLWRNIQREYAEELLGHDQYDGSGRPIDYARLEPFATLDRALADGRICVWCLGITLDALTLAGDILTVAVIEPEFYDDVFAEAVNTNTEGSVPERALPFEEHTIHRLRASGQLSPGAAAAIHLTWKHRDKLFLDDISAAAGDTRFGP